MRNSAVTWLPVQREGVISQYMCCIYDVTTDMTLTNWAGRKSCIPIHAPSSTDAYQCRRRAASKSVCQVKKGTKRSDQGVVCRHHRQENLFIFAHPCETHADFCSNLRLCGQNCPQNLTSLSNREIISNDISVIDVQCHPPMSIGPTTSSLQAQVGANLLASSLGVYRDHAQTAFFFLFFMV